MFAVVVALFLVALVGPLLAPPSIYTSNMLETLMPPSADHWLGTDDQGRDIAWRLVAGAQLSLLATMLVVILYSAIGMLVATLATVGPRWADELLMRISDIGLSLPGLVVALGIATVLGPSLQSGIIALALTGWPMTARILRTTMRQTMEQSFVEGATVLGVSRTRLMLKHVLPNSLDVLIVKWAGDLSYTMLILAGLSFIGVGAQPPSPEWGAMISGARSYTSIAWWAVAAPGAAIVINAVAFALLADILQVHRDPSLRS
ncbi:MAG TPA: ABC transporter permease [Devosia sp.]|uniref:ABC transporter permease n=1 Tax=Devosia sp. TaxID=1871048 RepID=UPI002DDCB458|nr:ABC transporter permease [Devosia sp.]HEV2517179.1 ABC transporter permease [Devosia sp.]